MMVLFEYSSCVTNDPKTGMWNGPLLEVKSVGSCVGADRKNLLSRRHMVKRQQAQPQHMVYQVSISNIWSALCYRSTVGDPPESLCGAGTRQSNAQLVYNASDPCHGCGGLNSTPKAASCFAFQYASVKPIVAATNDLVTAVASRSALVKGTIVMVA